MLKPVKKKDKLNDVDATSDMVMHNDNTSVKQNSLKKSINNNDQLYEGKIDEAEL